MPTLSRSLPLIAAVLLLVSSVFAQEKPAAAIPEDNVYKALRGLSATPDAFAGDYATVNNLVLKKDAATFTLKSGTVYFTKPIEGKVTGAVFMGVGEFSLTPTIDVEKKHLEIFAGTSTIKEPFDTLTMFFTDDTFDVIKSSPAVQMATGGAQGETARGKFRDKESALRTVLRYNITSRVLSDLYSKRNGMFMGFIDGDRFSKIIYSVDPLGISEVYPEQVELLSYGDTTSGIFTAFHMEDEYKRPGGPKDHRIYDIKNHTMDVTISGTRISAKDEVTLVMRDGNARFLPFDLYRTLRVRSVKDEAGNSLAFIQEKKEEDSELGVVLSAAPGAEKTIKLTFEYDGTEALREAGDGNFILLPRSTWYPNNPQANFGDRATYDITFRTPKKMVLVGVGSRMGVDVEEGDNKVSKWSSEGIEYAVAGFNYGDFRMKEMKEPESGLTIEVYTNRTLPNELRDAISRSTSQIERPTGRSAMTDEGNLGASVTTSSMAQVVLADAVNSTKIYNAYFGKVPFKRVAMTQQPNGFFGQAWPTLVFVPYIAFLDPTTRNTFFDIKDATSPFWREVAAHEVAHQWWGHALGWASYRDQWMSEGFSEFSTSLFIQFSKRDPAQFATYWEEQRDRITKATPETRGKKPYTVGPIVQGYRLNSAKTGSISRNLIYPKGAYILHMLRMLMYDHRGGTGDQKFQVMMREFISANHNKDVSTNDFKLAVEKHMLPSMDLDGNGKLDWFFNQWVYGTDIPSYRIEYSTKSNGAQTLLNGTITQSGVSETFKYPVPLYLDFGKGPMFMGSARMTGNKSLELKDIALPAEPKKFFIGGLQDILAEKIEVVKK
ncbi:MAG TPA: M1 family aminopeptidase [Pyrinomonadaceae bacterium]|nr:M1 family aminopeptidase [Pyrinomonadaceae bacterium]